MSHMSVLQGIGFSKEQQHQATWHGRHGGMARPVVILTGECAWKPRVLWLAGISLEAHAVWTRFLPPWDPFLPDSCPWQNPGFQRRMVSMLIFVLILSAWQELGSCFIAGVCYIIMDDWVNTSSEFHFPNPTPKQPPSACSRWCQPMLTTPLFPSPLSHPDNQVKPPHLYWKHWNR